MFFATAERISAVRRMIAAEELMEGEGSSAADALAALKVFQREDFEGIFEAMDGLPGGCRAAPGWRGGPRRASEVEACTAAQCTQACPAPLCSALGVHACAAAPPFNHHPPAVTIRLLDPPLHEFLPHEGTAELDALCDALATEMKGRSGQREWRGRRTGHCAHALALHARVSTAPAAAGPAGWLAVTPVTVD